MVKAAYKRVIIKLSGEALAGEKGLQGIRETTSAYVADVREVRLQILHEIRVKVGGKNSYCKKR